MTRGELVATLRGHKEGVRWLSFTRDGTKLITVSEDTTTIVWDVVAAMKAD